MASFPYKLQKCQIPTFIWVPVLAELLDVWETLQRCCHREQLCLFVRQHCKVKKTVDAKCSATSKHEERVQCFTDFGPGFGTVHYWRNF